MRLPTRFHILVTALRVRVISPKRNTLILVGSFADPSYQLRVLRYPEQATVQNGSPPGCGAAHSRSLTLAHGVTLANGRTASAGTCFRSDLVS